MTDKERIDELYAVKDKNTGKFVTTLTNPNKKYWDRKVARDKAIQSPSRNWGAGFKGNKEDLIPIDFVLIEKQDYLTNQNAKAVEALRRAKEMLNNEELMVFENVDTIIDNLIKDYGGENG